MKTRHLLLYPAPVAIAAGLLWAGLTPHTSWPDWHWENEPFHATVEALGALAAVSMTLVLVQRKQEEGGEKLFLLATGFLGMGLLDGFHAVSSAGRAFVFLHSMASLVGGLCFVLVWLADSGRYIPGKAWILWGMAAGSALCGSWALRWPGTLPAMIHNGEFTTTAIAVNFLAGMLFLAAAVRFALDFQRSGELEVYLFASLALLFGLAGLTFKYSLIWDSRWWLWHLLRLTAYLLVLGFVVHQYLQMVSVLRITLAERVRAEEALKEYSERLEEMVAERTQELCEAQEQLMSRERLAVLGQLAGGVSHELRNPLGAISNATYFLNMVLQDPKPKVQEALEILDKEVKTAENIIRSLLDLARDKAPLQQKVDLRVIIQEAVSHIAVPESVEILTQVDEAASTLPADPDQLAQVFGNLILNAVQAMPEGGRLTISSQISNSGWVSVSISDTGVGIPPENWGKLFEPLFTTKSRGIGLGLALVKSLIEGHGGKVEVESEVGRGSTFTISLPESGTPVAPQNNASVAHDPICPIQRKETNG
jgi:signal transduction histidine kinase